MLPDARPVEATAPRLHVMSWVGIGAIALTTFGALLIRLRDLHRATLSLSIDEARLTLVAQGLLEHAWPVLPSGKVYSRGLPAAFSMVPSLAFLGESDFAARLPSVILGAMLAPVVGAHAGRLGGLAAGVIAAILVAVYPPLVFWSRQAWFFSLFVLLWMLTLLCLDVAVTHRSRVALILGAASTALGLLTHELFVALLPCWLLALCVLIRRPGGPADLVRLLAGPLAMLLVGAAIFLGFLLTHRADTLVGRYGELREYLTLNSDLAGFRFYGRMLADRFWLLPLAGVLALIVRREPRVLLLLLAIVPLFLIDAFVLPDRPQERYGLALVPPMFILGVVGVSLLADRIRQRVPGRLGVAAAVLVMLLIPAIHLDLGGLMRRTDVSRASGTWLDDLVRMGFAGGDRVMTDVPTVTQLYLDRTDFWLVSREYEKYAYRPDGELREIHTNAILVRTTADLERVVRDLPLGQTLWVVGSDRSYQWQELVDRSVRRWLDDHAVARMQSADSTRLYRLQRTP